MFWNAQKQPNKRTLAQKERKHLSFQLGLPFGIFVGAIIVLLFTATYIVQDRSSKSTRIVPQAHADSIALRVEQAVEHSISIGSLIAHIAGRDLDAKNLEVVHTLIDSDPAILSVSYVNAKFETVWDIQTTAAPAAENMKIEMLPTALHFEQAIPGRGGIMLQTVHLPVYGQTGAQEGVLAIVYDISVFWELLADYRDGDAYIVDSKGAVILRRNVGTESTSTISATPGVQNFISRTRVVSEYTEEDGVGMLSAWSLVRLPGWAIVVEEPVAALYSELRAMYALIGFLMFIIVFLFVNEAIIVKRKIFMPLQSLAETAQRIARGEQNIWVGTDANNEFDTVGEAMNTMARNVQSLRQGLEDRIAERTLHLEEKTEEAERLNVFMVNRELRMLELKEKNKKLESELLALKSKGQEPMEKVVEKPE